MNQYAAQFLRDLDTLSQNETIPSLLDAFNSYYLMYCPVNDDAIREQLHSLDPVLKNLSGKRQRKLYRTVLALCTDYEKAAFQKGLQTGAQLILELLR